MIAAWLVKSHVPNVRCSWQVLLHVRPDLRPQRCEVGLGGQGRRIRWRHEVHHRGSEVWAHVLLEPGEEPVPLLFGDRHGRLP